MVRKKIYQNSWWQWDFAKGILTGNEWRIQ